MKTKKIASVLLVVIFLFGILNIFAYAENDYDEPVDDEPVEPFQYVNNYSADFRIIDGIAYTEFRFHGVQNTALRAEVEVRLQHRFLFWWSDVTDGTWNDTVYDYQGTVSHSLDLTQYGDFRAIFTVRVYGSGSDYDEINQTLYDSN